MTKDSRVCWATDYVKAKIIGNSPKIFTSMRHRSELICEQHDFELLHCYKVYTKCVKLGHCYETYIKGLFIGESRSIGKIKQPTVIPLNPTTGGNITFVWPSNVIHFDTDEIYNEIQSGVLYLPLSTNLATVDMVYPLIYSRL